MGQCFYVAIITRLSLSLSFSLTHTHTHIEISFFLPSTIHLSQFRLLKGNRDVENIRMDPLSITASAIAILQIAGSSANVLHTLLSLRDAPQQLLQLWNEAEALRGESVPVISREDKGQN
jgi:hypothetical protein